MKASLTRNQAPQEVTIPDEATTVSIETVCANENADTSDNESGDDIVLLETEADLSDHEFSDTIQESSTPPCKKSKLD